jgi:hypothetical protein
MQILEYEQYVRLHGIRFISNLNKPRLSDVADINFPKDSVLLYTGEFLDDYVPINTKDVYFANLTRKAVVYYKEDLNTSHGKVTHVSRNIRPAVNKFHSSNPMFKHAQSIDELRKIDANSLAVISLSLLDESYKYANNPLTNYYKTLNQLNTVFDSVKETNLQKHYYLPIVLPASLPTMAELNLYSKVVNSKISTFFSTIESVFLLELWRFFSDKPEMSILSTYDNSILNKVDIIFIHNNKWFTLNLGTLESYSNTSQFKVKNAISPSILRKLLLKSLLVVTVTGLVAETETEEDLDKVVTESDLDMFIESVSSPTVVKDILSNVDVDLEEEVKPETLLEVEPFVETDLSPLDKYKEILEANAEVDNLTSKEYRERLKSIDTLLAIKDPITNQPLIESATVSKDDMISKDDDITIPDSKLVLDKTMLKSKLIDFDRKYIKTVLPKHVKAMALNLMNAGVVIQSYNIDRSQSILGDVEIHTIKTKPLNGVTKTLSFKIPVMNEQGEFKTAGNTYRMRKQRVDLPIIKIAPGKVSLSSYYGKVFVNRSDLKTDDWTNYITDAILQLGYAEGSIITSIVPGGNFNNKVVTPKIYSTISTRISAFTVAGNQYYFDPDIYAELTTDIPLMVKDHRFCGISKRKLPIYVGFDDIFYELKDKEFIPIGDIYEITGVAKGKAPLEVSTATIFGESIPLAIVLGYLVGFFKLLKTLGVTPKIVPSNERVALTANEFIIKFRDYKLIFDKVDRKATMILEGFNKYDSYLKTVLLDQMKLPDIYLNLLEAKGLTTRYLREIDNVDKLFVDPITKGILIEMKEPVTFTGLLFRANELLINDHHPDIQDMRYARIRGNERIAGAVYRELIDSYRNYNARQIKGKNGLEMSPYKVWGRITSDPSVMMVADINPIENLKQQEAVTLVGDGGRSKDGISMDVRIYHETDVGVISEATVDSGDVGVNVFLSSSPNLTNLYGMTRDYKPEDGYSALLSTSGNVGVGTLNDNMRRAMFHSIQNSHTVGVKNYTQNYIRTGYDSIISSRVGPTFCVNATDDGVVTSVESSGILVTYKSGEKVGYKLGTVIGSAEGSYYPHDLVTNLTVNAKFKKGDNICYNNGFFEEDMLDPTKVVWKNALFYKVALLETPETYEDSSVISKRLAGALVADTIKQRSIVLDFNQAVHRPLKIGDSVDIDTLLLIIEDELTNRTGLFDEESIDALKRLSNLSPKAKYRGTISDIVVYYNGDLEFMTESLRKMVTESNSRLSRKAKASNSIVHTGAVDNEYRVDGNPLQPETLEIKYYVRVSNTMVSGDKVVYAAQLKSIVSVSETDVTTEDGQIVDALYGAKSVSARIVVSAFVNGTTTTLMKEIQKQAVDIYFK